MARPLSCFKVFAPLALGVLAIQIDYPVALTGEGAELIVGLIFLASALAATRLSARAVAGWLLAPVLVGWLVSTVLARVVFGSDEEGTRTAAAELAVLQADVVKGVTEELARKNVHKRVYTAVLDGYLELSGGAFLQGQGTPARPAGLAERKDRLGYFLDPWNNPYWVHSDKKSKTGRIYSFGPNRRRDLAVRDKTDDPGDDVIITFALADRDSATSTPGEIEPEPEPATTDPAP